jgi:hypothetical protein
MHVRVSEGLGVPGSSLYISEVSHVPAIDSGVVLVRLIQDEIEVFDY